MSSLNHTASASDSVGSNQSLRATAGVSATQTTFPANTSVFSVHRPTAGTND